MSKTGKSNDQTQTDQTQATGSDTQTDATTGAGTGDGAGTDTQAGAGTGDGAGTGADTGDGAGTGASAATGDGAGAATGDGAGTDAGTGAGTGAGEPKDYDTAQDPAGVKAMLEGTELVSPTDPEGKPTGSKKSYVAVFGGPMINPYTEDVFTAEASKPVKADSWIKRQIAEGKIAEAPEDDE